MIAAVLVIAWAVAASPGGALASASLDAARSASDADLVRAITSSDSRADLRSAAEELANSLDRGAVVQLRRKADKNERAQQGLEIVVDRLSTLASRSKSVDERKRVMLALAAAATEPAAAALAKAVTHDRSAKVRKAAASALGSVPSDVVSVAVPLLLEPSAEAFLEPGAGDVVKRAILSIGRAAIEPLGLVVESADPTTAQRAVGLLKALERREPEAVAAIWPSVIEPLVAGLAASELDFDASGLLVAIGEPAVGRLLEVARQPIVGESSGLQRSNAEFVLIQMAASDRSKVATLTDALASRDLALIADLANFFVQLGEPGSEDALIAALDAQGDGNLANQIVFTFLDSGHKPLVDAAHAWASRHGYTITGEGAGRTLWGNLGGDPTT